MVTRAVSEGRGISGLMAYLMHDKVTPGDRYPTTAERVAWAEPVGGSPTANVDLCVRIMQGVSADAAILKQLAGASNRGRKLRKPYAHFMTSWPPGEIPSREEMLEVGSAQLQALGCADRLAIALAHTDTDHAHFHLVVCKVHPETGMAASLNHSGLQLSRFAEQWEREHGGIVIENRVRRNEARDAFAAHVDRYMEENYKPAPNASLRDQAAHYDEIVKQARAEARELHPLPPMEHKRSRNAHGEPVRTTEGQRQFWSELYEKQRAEKLPEPEQRAQRAEASHLLRHGPAPRVGPEAEVAVPVAPAHPFPAPTRAVRVGPEAEVAVPVAPAHPFPAPTRAGHVGPEAEVAVPVAPAHPFPAPTRAVRVGPEAEVVVPEAPPPNPVYPDDPDEEKPRLDEVADKLARDHPRAPWPEVETVIHDRHTTEAQAEIQARAQTDEQAERRRACEMMVARRLSDGMHQAPGLAPRKYGTIAKWSHALADFVQTAVRKLFTREHGNHIDTRYDDTPVAAAEALRPAGPRTSPVPRAPTGSGREPQGGGERGAMSDDETGATGTPPRQQRGEMDALATGSRAAEERLKKEYERWKKRGVSFEEFMKVRKMPMSENAGVMVGKDRPAPQTGETPVRDDRSKTR